MLSRRQIVLALGAGAISCAVRSQTRTRLWQIGILAPVTSQDNQLGRDAFLRGMQDLGYVNGQDFIVHERLAQGENERLPGLAAELVKLKVDLIIASTTPAVIAAQRATSTIPIVFLFVADPVRSGFAESVGRPGRNITGLSNFSADLTAKRLELLKEMVPNLSRVALLVNPDNPFAAQALSRVQPVANSIGLRLIVVNSRTPEEIAPAFASMVRERIGAVVVTADTYHFGQRQRIADAANKYRIPSSFPTREYVEAGGLMSYGIDGLYQPRRIAAYVDKILKGANPGELPIEQPTTLELVINLKTAKALGITVPKSIQFRADRVIE